MTSGAAETTEQRSALVEILRDIRFEQTLFSLPFALLASFLAAGGLPPLRELGLMVAALVCARSAAMATNRAADALIDARNPRTAERAVPSGRVSRGTMAGFAALATALFALCAWALNPLCLALSPVALLFLIGYSWTKRLTPLCHAWLGLTVGIAPAGAWAALRGDFDGAFGGWTLTPWLLGFGVAAWVAGFDVFYACPDADKDRDEGLHSIPRALGVERAFTVSRVLHVLAVLCFVGTGLVTPELGALWWGGLAVGVLILLREHSLVAPGRYDRMFTAFFELNAVFGGVLLAAGVADTFV